MEDADAHFAPPQLPDALSVEKIPEAKRPLPEDWKLVQGGMPKVKPVRPGLFNVIHDYHNLRNPEGTGVIVPTSVAVVENWSHKTITLMLSNGRTVEFPTALLWKYHGKGCESRSRTRYNRVAVKPDNTNS
jgi:hypothetical protein